MELMKAGEDKELNNRIRALVERLRGAEESVKEESFRRFLEELDPFAVEMAEDKLSRDDLRILCDAHVRYMGEITEDEEELLEMPGHPIHTLMEEHVQILVNMEEVRRSATRMARGEGSPEDRERLADLGGFITEAQKHFQREENILFPYLERHGITGPPARMWAEHDVLRRKEKELVSLVEELSGPPDDPDLIDRIVCSSSQLLSLLNAHFYKENHVLFPQSIRVMDMMEWNDMRRQFDEVGCCSFVPHHAAMAFQTIALPDKASGSSGKNIVLPTGRFTAEELEMVLNALPVDISFVADDDRLHYYSGGADRIFIRTPAVLGRKVENCHPQKSVHVVKAIIDDFKAGRRDQAEFWIDIKGRTIHIRYWPLRDKAGAYKGVLEMVQDVTAIRQLEGEKRLLDQP